MNGPESTKGMSLWRDYRYGMVGFQAEGEPRRLITPARAREIADIVEARAVDEPQPSRAELQRFVDDLREYADDVEGVADK